VQGHQGIPDRPGDFRRFDHAVFVEMETQQSHADGSLFDDDGAAMVIKVSRNVSAA
jgi:hypothetical protein